MASPSNRERFPELYNQTYMDRRTCTRLVHMRVLVLGMMRTGTMCEFFVLAPQSSPSPRHPKPQTQSHIPTATTMHSALDELGQGPVYHMLSIFHNPPDSTMWTEALNAKYFHDGRPYTRSDGEQLLGHCAAVTDVPCACFAEEPIAAYPEAKVILTNRHVNAWHASCMTTVIPALRNPFILALSYFDTDFLGLWRPMIGKMIQGAFGGTDGLEANGKQMYREHYDKVRAMVPKERLLLFEVGEGWERLCEFLEVHVPEGAVSESS